MGPIQSTGIFAPSFPSAETEISRNDVSDNDVGIYVLGIVDYVVSDNVLRNNRLFDIVIQDGTARAERNTIAGRNVGVGVVAATEDATGILGGNEIRNTSVAPAQTIECCGFTATIISE